MLKQSFSKHGKYTTFLKSEHANIHSFAYFITLKSREADAASSDADNLVANQYKDKESLKPIFNKLLVTSTHLETDVEVVAKNMQ